MVQVHPFDHLAGMVFTERKRIVAAERDAIRAEQADHVIQHVGFVYEGVNKKLSDVVARIAAVCGCHDFRTYIEAVFEAADDAAKRPAAVG